MIDEMLAESLGFKRHADEPQEHFDMRVRALFASRRHGTVADLALAIKCACWNVADVGYREVRREQPRTWWERFTYDVATWWQRNPWRRQLTLMETWAKRGPVTYPVAQFVVIAKRGTEPNAAAIREAVDTVRPVAVLVELDYYEATP